MTVANDDSGFISPDYEFPSSKSNCTILNKWHVISVTWSNRNSNCWSYGEKIMTFNTGNAKGTNHCIIGDIGKTTIKGELQRENKLISYQRAFKMLENDM